MGGRERRGEEKKREEKIRERGEKDINVRGICIGCLCPCPTGPGIEPAACNPDMYPWQPDAWTTEPHQPGLNQTSFVFLKPWYPLGSFLGSMGGITIPVFPGPFSANTGTVPGKLDIKGTSPISWGQWTKRNLLEKEKMNLDRNQKMWFRILIHNLLCYDLNWAFTVNSVSVSMPIKWRWYYLLYILHKKCLKINGNNVYKRFSLNSIHMLRSRHLFFIYNLLYIAKD